MFMFIFILGLSGFPILLILLGSWLKYIAEKGFPGTSACLLLYIVIFFFSFFFPMIKTTDLFNYNVTNLLLWGIKIILILNTFFLAISFVIEYRKKMWYDFLLILWKEKFMIISAIALVGFTFVLILLYFLSNNGFSDITACLLVYLTVFMVKISCYPLIKENLKNLPNRYIGIMFFGIIIFFLILNTLALVISIYKHIKKDR